jgi:hypothetical protein
MSEAKTDIRATSYDSAYARPDGFQGDFDEVLTQMRCGAEFAPPALKGRAELLHYLGVDKVHNSGSRLDLDERPRYGFDEPAAGPGFYTLQYALDNWPQNFLSRQLLTRILMLSPSQLVLYRISLEMHYSAEDAVARAEAYPYPAPKA